MNKSLEITSKQIENRIYRIRGVQVILDRDLAEFYHTETRSLKQAVRRNIERFPEDFMFVLDDTDIEFMVSQSVIPSKQYLGGAKPFAFTEQGVAMLSSVLSSERAIEVSLLIMRAFASMRKFLIENASIFQRLENIEYKQFESDKKFERIFKALESKNYIPDCGVFFEGQIFDAYELVSKIIRSAKNSITLIDNYIDETIFTILSKKEKNIKVTILTKNISNQLALDVKKANQQYENFEIIKFNKSHDRFLIIDNEIIYHLGASLKDMGKKWFAFSKMSKSSVESILKSLGKIK